MSRDLERFRYQHRVEFRVVVNRNFIAGVLSR